MILTLNNNRFNAGNRIARVEQERTEVDQVIRGRNWSENREPHEKKK